MNRQNSWLSTLSSSVWPGPRCSKQDTDRTDRVQETRKKSQAYKLEEKERERELKETKRNPVCPSGETNSSLDTGRGTQDRKTIYQSLDNWSLGLVPAEVELLSVSR